RTKPGHKLALPPTLAIPSIHRVSSRWHMGNKKSKSKANSNGSRPRNGARPTSARGPAGALVRRVERSSNDLRTYSIPDLRLEHPDFTVSQHIEKDSKGHERVRYVVEGDLAAPVPPIRD